MTQNDSPAWEQLPAQAQEYLSQHKTTKNFSRGQFIYHMNEQPAGLYLVESGLVGIIIYSSSGAEHLLRLYKTGQYFGHRSLLAEEPYHAGSICLQDCTISLIPKKIVQDIFEKFPQSQQLVIRYLAQDLGRAERQRVSISEKEVQARIAESLIYLLTLHPEYNWTRKEIASFCGTTTATAIKALAQLEEMGLIQQSGRKIQILQRQKLEQLTE